MASTHHHLLPITTVLILLWAAAASDTGEFWNTFGAMNTMKECLHPIGFITWVRSLERAQAVCNELPLMPLTPPLPADWEDVMNNYSSRNSSIKYSPERLQRLKGNMERRVQIFRCVMQNMKVTGHDNQVNTTSLGDQYRALEAFNVSRDFIVDIEEAIEMCDRFSKCLPVDGPSRSPVPFDVIRTMVFLECSKRLRYQACLTDDVRPFVDRFDLSGLDGRLNSIRDVAGRVAALVKAHHELGPASYGLYE